MKIGRFSPNSVFFDAFHQKLGIFMVFHENGLKRGEIPHFGCPGPSEKHLNYCYFCCGPAMAPFSPSRTSNLSPFHQNSAKMGGIPLKFIKVGENGVNRVPGGATRPRSSQNVTIIKPFAASRAARDSHFFDFST